MDAFAAWMYSSQALSVSVRRSLARAAGNAENNAIQRKIEINSPPPMRLSFLCPFRCAWRSGRFADFPARSRDPLSEARTSPFQVDKIVVPTRAGKSSQQIGTNHGGHRSGS